MFSQFNTGEFIFRFSSKKWFRTSSRHLLDGVQNFSISLDWGATLNFDFVCVKYVFGKALQGGSCPKQRVKAAWQRVFMLDTSTHGEH